MSHILYGIQSTGNGHLAKSTLLIKELRKLGNTVDVILSGVKRPEEDWYVNQLQPIKQYQGLVGYTNQGKFCRQRTLKEMNLRQLACDIKNLDLSSYDFVISDFDHISAWAAKLQKKMALGISRASTLFYKVPKLKRFFLSNHFMYLSVPVDLHIGLHWHHFNQPILPPMIYSPSLENININNELITVYMPTETLADLQNLCILFPNFKFHIYHYEMTEPRQIGNLFFFPPNQSHFRESLRHCAGVMCNAGFNLISEALILRKKILAKPVKGFAEQFANIFALKKLGVGTIIEKLDPKLLGSWLEEKKPEQEFKYPDVAFYLSQWIHDGNWDQLGRLSQQLWAQSVVQGRQSTPIIK